MVAFFDLLTFELKRAKFFYFSLLGFVFSTQILGISYNIFSLKHIDYTNPDHAMHLTFDSLFSNNFWYHFVFIFSMSALFFYAFYTWAREWKGQGNFIYRLMMLPVNRLSIAYTKLLALILMTFQLIALQYLFAWFVNGILSTTLSNHEYRFCCSTYGINQTSMLLPNTLLELLYLTAHGLGILLIIYNVTIHYFSTSGLSPIRRILNALLEIIISFAGLYLVYLPRMNFALTVKESVIIFYIGFTLWLLLLTVRLHYLMKKKLSV